MINSFRKATHVFNQTEFIMFRTVHVRRFSSTALGKIVTIKMATTCEPLGEFPVCGLLPRRETGVISYLAKNPTFDGRGVVIAIFDSGVDPGAPGLQVTTDGKVKVIDRIDASGAGDVDTSMVVEASEGIITGLTGRKLKIPESWVNPSGKFHVGMKSAFSLYPQQLKERIIKERKEKNWDPLHKVTLAEAQRKYQAHEASKNNNANNNNGNGLGLIDKLVKEDLEARVAQLNTLEKKYSDIGPAFDCIVYHDGSVWRVCIDTSETGDLESSIQLGEYRVTHNWSPLTPLDQYNISVNVYSDGNVLEIVGMCSSHGTHVASIAAANFPDDPDKNGVAPGAQVVSITIGDNRLGCMETGTAVARAMIRAMENPYYKVDVINMSYGEHAHWSNSGRLGELASEVVNKFGIIWVAAAGNHGPALGTVNVPPDFQNDSVIGVGAYVSPDMMIAEYSMIQKLPGCPYTWTSRGPTADGARGVSVCAPGSAITSVPSFTLKSSQLMNGTSMASPHAAGCVALLLSGLKQRSLVYSPYSVRRALEITAQCLDVDVFAQGHGLIQVEKALDYLFQFNGGVEDKIRFSVSCSAGHQKGIHLRNWKADKPIDIAVTVEPVMLNDLQAEASEKLAFNMELVLTCNATWVRAPSCLHMSYSSREFQISIDPRGLERGYAFFTSVKAYRSSQSEKGPVFEVPITIITPLLDLEHGYYFKSSPEVFHAGRIKRNFIYVPLTATWATVNLRTLNSDKCQRYTFHSVQLKPNCSVKTLENYKVINLSDNERASLTFAVRGGFTLELCLARWWSSLVDGQIELEVNFHSLQPQQEEITFLSSDGFQRVDVRAGLRPEELSPQATLKQHAQILMPVEGKVEVLGGIRDTVPDRRPIYQLVLNYNFTTSKSCEVTPKCVFLNDVLYESAYESQLWMLFDSNKQLLGSGDAYPNKTGIKLEKGDYTIRMHVRHERSDLLEKLTDLPVTLVTKLSQEIKLDIFTSYNAAVTGGKKIAALTLANGCIQSLYISAPNLTEKNLKSLGLAAGQALLGTISFAKDENVKKAVSNHKFGPIRTMPDSYAMRILITEMPCKKRSSGSTISSASSSNNSISNSSGNPTEEKKETKTNNDYLEALRDIQTSWITKLEGEDGERLYQEVITAHPEHLAAQLARLQALDALGAESRPAVIAHAKLMIASVDESLLLSYYGTKTDTRSDAAKIKTQMDKQRNILLETLSRLGSALCQDILLTIKADRSADVFEPLDTIAIDIMKFTEPTDSRVSSFFALYYQVRGFDGLAAKLLLRLCEEKCIHDNEQKLREAYERLGWQHVASCIASAHPLKFPAGYTPF